MLKKAYIFLTVLSLTIMIGTVGQIEQDNMEYKYCIIKLLFSTTFMFLFKHLAEKEKERESIEYIRSQGSQKQRKLFKKIS